MGGAVRAGAESVPGLPSGGPPLGGGHYQKAQPQQAQPQQALGLQEALLASEEVSAAVVVLERGLRTAGAEILLVASYVRSTAVGAMCKARWLRVATAAASPKGFSSGFWSPRSARTLKEEGLTPSVARSCCKV